MKRLALWLAMSLPAAASGAGEAIRYCDHPVYPPISWTDAQGRVRGVAPEAVRDVARTLGLDVEFVQLGNWTRCLMDAAQGRVDLVIAYRSPAREETLRFSRVALLREEVALFFHRDRPIRVSRLEDLARYRGGLLFGESYGQAFDRFVEAHGNVERVASNEQNFGKLARGRIDFLVHERRTGQLFLESLDGAGRIEALPQTLAVDYLYFAVSRRSPLQGRMAEIDAALQGLAERRQVERWLRESTEAYRATQARTGAR
ncbi:transporter substrate-binding domain-containing protein [Metapseudomonas furukawaii]|uniref:substrate-binding periplasmic protein n=1 Tax=Metapseudomonas furukawaii TaxID=1149133 RepID=UPI00227D25E6|nr:transporter substrate-binding domain-containing protein [Pseudomonas furukawaii]WAG80620.1 transporter substrate-binding domain-containing protein [Pseudomonas furukawaii]